MEKVRKDRVRRGRKRDILEVLLVLPLVLTPIGILIAVGLGLL